MIKKGILKAFDSGTYLASVQLIGSLSIWLNNVPTCRTIFSAEMTSGCNVAVLFIVPSSFSEAVIAIWD